MRNLLFGFLLIGIFSGFSHSQGSKKGIQDYIKIINKNTVNDNLMLEPYVIYVNQPSILDLKNDYAKYLVYSNSPFKKWSFVELAVWRSRDGLEVLGFNYQTTVNRRPFVECPPCDPETRFFTYESGDKLIPFPSEQSDFFYWEDLNVKNKIFLKALEIVEKTSVRLDLTELLDSSWNLRYVFPRYGTTIEAYLYDGILKRSVQKKTQKPLFYLKWVNGRFIPSLTK
jgi:hypothetical protein